MVKAVEYVAAFVVLTSLPFVVSHTALHGFSLLQTSLAVFLSVNVMVSWWEIGLFINRKAIRVDYESMRKSLKGQDLPSPMFMFTDVSLREALKLKYWGLVWSTYSNLDPSYSDQMAFGFWVDVGNGFTTIIPSMVYAVCMTWPLLSARVIGIMGLIKFYQEMYGTFIYFSSYVVNERYKGKSTFNVIFIVLLPNLVWVVFPMIGLYTSYQLLEHNTYAVFR